MTTRKEIPLNLYVRAASILNIFITTLSKLVYDLPSIFSYPAKSIHH